MTYPLTYRTNVRRTSGLTCVIFANEGFQTNVDLDENNQFNLGYRNGYNFDYHCQSDLEDAIALISEYAREIGRNTTVTNVTLGRIDYPDGSYKTRIHGHFS